MKIGAKNILKIALKRNGRENIDGHFQCVMDLPKLCWANSYGSREMVYVDLSRNAQRIDYPWNNYTDLQWYDCKLPFWGDRKEPRPTFFIACEHGRLLADGWYHSSGWCLREHGPNDVFRKIIEYQGLGFWFSRELLLSGLGKAIHAGEHALIEYWRSYPQYEKQVEMALQELYPESKFLRVASVMKGLIYG